RGALGAFLYGVARNRVMKHRERLPREIPLEEKNEDGTGSGIVLQDASTPAMWAEKRERMQQVRAAVLDWPVDFREAVVLCEVERVAAREHANTCSRCAALQESWQAAGVDLRAFAEDTAMAQAPARVEMRLRQEFRTQHVTFKVRRAAVVAAWALAAAAVFAG